MTLNVASLLGVALLTHGCSFTETKGECDVRHEIQITQEFSCKEGGERKTIRLMRLPVPEAPTAD